MRILVLFSIFLSSNAFAGGVVEEIQRFAIQKGVPTSIVDATKPIIAEYQDLARAEEERAIKAKWDALAEYEENILQKVANQHSADEFILECMKEQYRDAVLPSPDYPLKYPSWRRLVPGIAETVFWWCKVIGYNQNVIMAPVFANDLVNPPNASTQYDGSMRKYADREKIGDARIGNRLIFDLQFIDLASQAIPFLLAHEFIHWRDAHRNKRLGNNAYTAAGALAVAGGTYKLLEKRAGLAAVGLAGVAGYAAGVAFNCKSWEQFIDDEINADKKGFLRLRELGLSNNDILSSAEALFEIGKTYELGSKLDSSCKTKFPTAKKANPHPDIDKRRSALIEFAIRLK